MKKIIMVIAIVFFVLLGEIFATITLQYNCKVVDVIDGNTIIVLRPVFIDGEKIEKETELTLDGLDAPELGQPGGKAAKAFLEELIKGGKVFVIKKGRTQEAWVWINYKDKRKRKSINLLMVQNGFAWRIKNRVSFYVFPNGIIPIVESKAKKQKKGIWAKANPIPPWEWRKNKEEVAKKKKQDALEEVEEQAK